MTPDAGEAALEVAVERSGQSWTIRLPLRREELRVEKRTVIAERLIIRPQVVPDVARVEANLRREELRVEGDDQPPVQHPVRERRRDLEETLPLDATTRLGVQQDRLE
jgi:stress response protein YsnF